MTNFGVRLDKAKKLLRSVSKNFSKAGRHPVKKRVKRKNGRTFLQTFWESANPDIPAEKESSPKKEGGRTKFTYSKEVQKAIDIGYSIIGEHKDELDAAVDLYNELDDQLNWGDDRNRLAVIESMLTETETGRKRSELIKEKRELKDSMRRKAYESSVEVENMGIDVCAKLKRSLIENSTVSREQVIDILSNQYTIQVGAGAYALEDDEAMNALYQEMADAIRVVNGRGLKDKMTFKIGHPTEDEIKKGQTRSYASSHNGLIRIMPPWGSITESQDGKVAINSDVNQLLWHEMGHHVEYGIKREWELEYDSFPEEVIPYPHSLGQMIVKDRAEGDLRPLSEVSPRYGSNEEYYPDKWIDPYCGKYYKDKVTEVVSMGLQYFANEKKMFELYRKDPDHFAFTIGFARGNAHRRDFPYGFGKIQKR
jgi:hypothetical protein